MQKLNCISYLSQRLLKFLFGDNTVKWILFETSKRIAQFVKISEFRLLAVSARRRPQIGNIFPHNSPKTNKKVNIW